MNGETINKWKEGLWDLSPSAVDQDTLIIKRKTTPTPSPDDWESRLVRARKKMGLAMAGAKRITPDDKIFSMGEFILHPKSFHYVGQGVPAYVYRFPVEVDAITGGIIAVDRDKFDAVADTCNPGTGLELIELSLAMRQQGGRCAVMPDVSITDTHTIATTPEANRSFEKRFGFNWELADLDAATRRWAGSPLLWNVRFFGNPMPFAKYEQRDAMHWQSYAQVDMYRQRADHIVKLLRQVCPDNEAPALDLGCGDGLFTHLCAKQGMSLTGIDLESAGINAAKQQTAEQSYPGAPPAFQQVTPGPLPFEDNHFQLVYFLDVIEHLPNPAAVLPDIFRVIRPGGFVFLTTPEWRHGISSDPVYHLDEYTPTELKQQIDRAGKPFNLATVQTGNIGGAYRDIVLVARKAK